MSKVQVFLSWSGERSKHVAKALNEWLPDVIQNTVPFFSNEIYAGARWFETIGKQLESSNFAILCITRENAKSPWVNFEAGACAKRIDIARVVPYLIDGEPTDYEPPLSMFQSVRADEAGTLGLLKSLNMVQGEDRFDDAKLERLFRSNWERLMTAIMATPVAEVDRGPARTNEDMFAEILMHLRGLSSSSDQVNPPKKPLPPDSSGGPIQPIAQGTAKDVAAALEAITATDSRNSSFGMIANLLGPENAAGFASVVEGMRAISRNQAIVDQMTKANQYANSIAAASKMAEQFGGVSEVAHAITSANAVAKSLDGRSINPAITKWGTPPKRKP